MWLLKTDYRARANVSRRGCLGNCFTLFVWSIFFCLTKILINSRSILVLILILIVMRTK